MKTLWIPTVVIAWICAIGIGFAGLWEHDQTPRRSAYTGPAWPAASRLAIQPGRPTLMMFAHPHCPCTLASLHELARLLSHSGGNATCYVVFEHPAGTPRDWAQTPSRRVAEAIPGVQTREDNGTEAKLFGAQTSGQTLLFNARGRLGFKGGLTEARGHEGDNAGENAVLALLRGDYTPQRVVTTPVFGCLL